MKAATPHSVGPQPAVYTAREIAAALGKTRQAIRCALSRTPATGQAACQGNLAETWDFESLPLSIKEQLVAVANRQGFRNPKSLLTQPPALWQPKASWSEVSETAQAKAIKWRQALLPFLQNKNAEDQTQAEFERFGCAAYQKEFGHAISGRWFREMFRRTLDRDRGREDFTRLELYLDDNVAGRPPKPANDAAFDHSALDHTLFFVDAAKPSLAEIRNAFEYSFGHFDDFIAGRHSQRCEIKCSLLRYLFASAPALADSAGALKRNWNRKYARWKSGGETPSVLLDLRTRPAAGSHLKDLAADLELIVAEAFHHDGKLSIAIRKLRREGKLSAAFTRRYTLDVRRNKTYVAKTIRREIKERLCGLLAYRRSQHQVDMEGPRISRTHNERPGDFFAADDVTFNVVFWHDDNGRPMVTRGECLMFFDCRTLYPLGYVLTPGKYNGETVRRGILHIHDRHGLPHRGFVFEKGIWKSRLVVGNRPRDFLAWDEYEMNLRDNGLKIEVRNVSTPQAKLIEGLFNILQQNQRNQVGFVGFNERDYGQERLQKIIGQVKRGIVHPAEHFLSLSQWSAALDKSVEEYMHEPQNGKLLQGQSPAEAFASHGLLRRLPAEARFLLASHRVRTRVKADGLSITVRGKRRKFYNEALARYRGRQVLAWFNVEQPDLLTVSDLAMKEFCSVPQYELPAFDATDAQLSEVNRQRHAFMRPAKLQFDAIKHPVRRSISCDNYISEEVRPLGAHIQAQKTARANEEKAQERKLNHLDDAAARAGVTLTATIRNPERILRGIEILNQSPVNPEQNFISRGEASPAPVDCLPAPSPFSRVQYWEIVTRIEKLNPDFKARHNSIIQKTLGSAPSVSEMTPGQFAKMIPVLTALLRDTQQKAAILHELC